MVVAYHLGGRLGIECRRRWLGGKWHSRTEEQKLGLSVVGQCEASRKIEASVNERRRVSLLELRGQENCGESPEVEKANDKRTRTNDRSQRRQQTDGTICQMRARDAMLSRSASLHY